MGLRVSYPRLPTPFPACWATSWLGVFFPFSFCRVRPITLAFESLGETVADWSNCIGTSRPRLFGYATRSWPPTAIARQQKESGSSVIPGRRGGDARHLKTEQRGPRQHLKPTSQDTQCPVRPCPWMTHITDMAFFGKAAQEVALAADLAWPVQAVFAVFLGTLSHIAACL